MHPAQATGFDWDDESEDHLARHGITPEEVEQVFGNGPAWARNKKGRRAIWKMIGWTNGGRALAIYLNVRDETATLDIVTGYDATAADSTRFLSKRRRKR